MKIFIAGAAGQVGHYLCKIGQANAHDIFAYDSAALNICDAALVIEKLTTDQPDVIINAAAYTAVDKAETESDLAFAVNRDGVENLTNAAKMLDIPLLHISTDYVFNGAQETPYQETDWPDPQSVYGQSKWDGEQIVATYRKHIILRTAWVYAAYGNNFLKTMLSLGQRHLATGEPELRIVADQIGSPTSAFDIAETLLIMAEKLMENDPSTESLLGTYHYTGAGYCSWYDFAREIFDELEQRQHGEITSVAIPSTDYPTPAKRPSFSRLDCQKITDKFGIQPKIWQERVKETITEILELAQ